VGARPPACPADHEPVAAGPGSHPDAEPHLRTSPVARAEPDGDTDADQQAVAGQGP